MGAGSRLSCHPWVPEPNSAHFLASVTHSNNNLGARLRAPGCAGYFSQKHRRQGLLLSPFCIAWGGLVKRESCTEEGFESCFNHLLINHSIQLITAPSDVATKLCWRARQRRGCGGDADGSRAPSHAVKLRFLPRGNFLQSFVSRGSLVSASFLHF